jgi:hypothetical protein
VVIGPFRASGDRRSAIVGDIEDVGSENEENEDFEGQVHRAQEDAPAAVGDEAASGESEEDDFEGHKHLGAEKHLKHLKHL